MPASPDSCVTRDPRPAGATKAPTVEIVVPVYNEERALPGCLRTLHARLREELPFPWRITVADNASVDRTLEVARELADALIRLTHGARFSDAQCGFKAARVFERFYRVDPARSREHGGSGLGLAIAIATTITQGHAGRLELDTEPGRGSTFRLLLPTYPAEHLARLRRAVGDCPVRSGAEHLACLRGAVGDYPVRPGAE